MGWRLDEVKETIEPVVAREKQNTEYFAVDKGYVIGIKQSAAGTSSGRQVVRLDLQMSLGAKDPHDSIEIDGSPPLKLHIPGGIAGDVATASIMANCIPLMARSRQTGLLTMRDLPVVPYFRPRSPRRDDLE